MPPPSNRTINLQHCWPPKSHLKKQATCRAGGMAPRFQQRWRRPPSPQRNNQLAALLASFDATHTKQSTCGVGGLLPRFQQHC